MMTDTLWLNGVPARSLYVDGQLRWTGIVHGRANTSYITYHAQPDAAAHVRHDADQHGGYRLRAIAPSRARRIRRNPYQIALPLIIR